MWFHFDRRGHYRGFSASPVLWVLGGALAVIFGLAVGYRLFLLAPVIALWVLVILAARSEIRRHRARRADREKRASA